MATEREANFAAEDNDVDDYDCCDEIEPRDDETDSTNDEDQCSTKENDRTFERKQSSLKVFAISCLIAHAMLAAFVLYNKNNIDNEPHCYPQKEYVLQCDNVTIFKGWERTGLMDYEVVFQNPFNDNVNVSKFDDKERIVVLGSQVQWHGTHDLSKNKRIPNTTISFRDKNRPHDQKCHRAFHMECPALDSKLEEMTTEWQKIEEQKPPKKFPLLYHYVVALSGPLAFMAAVFYTDVDDCDCCGEIDPIDQETDSMDGETDFMAGVGIHLLKPDFDIATV